MARPSNTEERRCQIVDGLLHVIGEEGYYGASVQEIAEAAGLAPGLIHYHFKAKLDILLALVERVEAIALARYEQFSRDATTPQEMLRAFVDAWLAFGRGANPKAVKAWVIIGAEAVREESVREAYEGAIARRRDILVSLLAEYGENRLNKRQNERLAGIVLAAMEGAYQLSVTSRKTMPQNYAARTVMQVIEACTKIGLRVK